MEVVHSFGYVESSIGLLELEANALGLVAISFVSAATRPDDVESPVIQTAKVQLREYLDGERESFTIPLNPAGTHFQLNVWDELSKIPYSRMISYEDLAKRLGDIKVIRAAASANGKNPLPIVIPCHRVIGKDGTLTGYSGGLWRKQWLLELEQRNVQTRLFQ